MQKWCAWFHMSTASASKNCWKRHCPEHLVFLVFSNKDTGHWNLNTDDTKDMNCLMLFRIFLCFFQVKMTCLLCNTALILTQLMFNINMQTRQHKFSMYNLFTWENSCIIPCSHLIVDHVPKWWMLFECKCWTAFYRQKAIDWVIHTTLCHKMVQRESHTKCLQYKHKRKFHNKTIAYLKVNYSQKKGITEG